MRYSTEAQAKIEAAQSAVNEAETASQAAWAKLRRVRSAASIQAASDAVGAAREVLHAASDALTEARRDALRELTDTEVTNYFQSAATELFYATLGDYSMGSISRAERERDDAAAVLKERGLYEAAEAARHEGN